MNQVIPAKEKLVALFSKHLVPIHFFFKKGTLDHHAIVTSFVISVKGAWFLVTAGHCLREVKENLEIHGCTLHKAQLIDYTGLEAKHFHPIPFDFLSSTNVNIKDEEYDYGIVLIEEYYKNLLEANGIVPLNEEVWEKQPENPEFYFLLGVPGGAVETPKDKLTITTSFNLVEKCQTKPDCFEPTGAPTFYGKVHLDSQITDIKGMSGGPIFSFKRTKSGQLKYWLCAVQSRWFKKERLLAAGLATPFISLVKSTMESIEQKYV